MSLSPTIHSISDPAAALPAVLDVAGWIVLGALTIVLLLQTRVLRRFTRPQETTGGATTALSVVLLPAGDGDTRRLLSEVSHSAYRGEMEILLSGRTGETARISALALASSKARVVIVPDQATNPLAAIAREARGETLLVLPATFRLEPDTLGRLVSEAVADAPEAIGLLPRLDLRSTEILLDPIPSWIRLTLPLTGLAESVPTSSLAVLAPKGCLADEGTSSRIRYVDGFDSASRGALSREDLFREVRRAVGGSLVHRATAALLLILLFTLPPLVAIMTTSFPWVVSAVASYWIRLRVAARTGEPVVGAILHPVSCLAAAAVMMGWSTERRPATNTDDLRT